MRRKVNEWETERPPDEAVLVRGAPMTPSGLFASARKCFREPRYRYYGLSVATFPNSTPQQIATRYRLPHDDFCVSTAQAVRAAGHEVVMRDEHTAGHASIVFAHEPSEDEINTIIHIFGDCQQNMTSETRRPRPKTRRSR